MSEVPIYGLWDFYLDYGMIGGLLTSTLLTLFVLPILYHWVENKSFTFKPNKKLVMTTALVLLLFGFSPQSNAQELNDTIPEISLQEAIKLSKSNCIM